jgi:hypothetical protein
VTKILHFNIFKSVPKGVLNQIADEFRVKEKIENIDQWDIKVFSHDQTTFSFQEKVDCSYKNAFVKGVMNYVLLRKKAYGWLAQVAAEYDAVFLRHRAGDVFEYLYSSQFGKYFTVHHTMEVPEARTRKFPLGLLESNLEKYTGPRILDRAQGIIGVTPEIVEYELSRISKPMPSFCHPNGIDVQQYCIVPDEREGVPKLLFVTSYDAPWHGIDLLLKNLTHSKEKYELHLVGDVTLQTGDDTRIVYHGLRDDRYIEALASKCDVGLSSFALSRKNMTQACPLKTRQYLAMGLPVYSGHMDSGLPLDFPYYKNGGLNMDELFKFTHNARSISREEVRSASCNYIDKRQLMEKLACWISSVG